MSHGNSELWKKFELLRKFVSETFMAYFDKYLFEMILVLVKYPYEKQMKALIILLASFFLKISWYIIVATCVCVFVCVWVFVCVCMCSFTCVYVFGGLYILCLFALVFLKESVCRLYLSFNLIAGIEMEQIDGH